MVSEHSVWEVNVQFPLLYNFKLTQRAQCERKKNHQPNQLLVTFDFIQITSTGTQLVYPNESVILPIYEL